MMNEATFATLDAAEADIVERQRIYEAAVAAAAAH